MGDPTQVHQILMNLCTNAGYAMREEGGTLTIGLENLELDADSLAHHGSLNPGPYVVLTVGDTGQGMSSEVLEKIFDPFYTTKEKGEGTGMGLSVVHGIVKSYGGDIYAYSEKGQGSTFKVFLPAIERRVEPASREESKIPTGTETILLVDDEQPLADIGKELLESLGYKVTTRTSSIDALEQFRVNADKYDLVITDMTMPNMTGEELARNILTIRPDIPIILCTGFSSAMTEESALAVGIRALVMKPILKKQIGTTIRSVLDEPKEM
jgi:CheY-like chemotaxis protein